MGAYFKENCALSLQILRGEIRLPASHDTEATHSNGESLALRRSNSYTLSAESQLSDLLAGAPVSESSGSERTTSTDDDSDATVPYHGMSPAPVPGAEADNPDSAEDADAPHGVTRATSTTTEPPPDGEKAGDRNTPAVGEDRFVTPTTRRSRRIQGKNPEAQDGLRKSIRAASRRSARRGKQPRDETEEEDKNEPPEAEQKEPQPEAGARRAPQGEAGEPPHPVEPGAGASTHSEHAEELAQYKKRMARRMRRLQKKLQRERRRSVRRRGVRNPRDTSETFKGIVDRAKAIRELTRHTISPELWDALPSGFKAEAYNRANTFAWDAIKASLGYENSHLLGQLREGDGKGAWLRMTTLHAETTMGAQAHHLAKLMKCSYESTARSKFGGIRLYAEALQDINKNYKLASGEFVQPDILMAKVLSLPEAYDSVVNTIESEVAERRRSGNRTLDFPAVVARIVAFENRQTRRSGTRKGRGTSPAPRSHHRSSRRPERSTSWRRRRQHGSRDRAFTAHGQNRVGGRKFICWRCGKEGHAAAQCRETTDVNGKSIPGDGQLQFRNATAKRADVRRKLKGKERRRRPRRPPPSRGFLAQEVHGQALTSTARKKTVNKLRDTVIIDSGATIHCCTKGTRLDNARATSKVIQAAGSQTLDASTAGDWGKLVDTVAVAGLRSALASAGRLADHYQAALIFTPKKVLSMPLNELKAALGGQADVLGHRAPDGLYKAKINRVNRVFDAARGYEQPRSVAVGALARSANEDLTTTTGEPAEVLHALSAWQDNDQSGSLKRPRLRRYTGNRRGSTRPRRTRRGVRRAHSPELGEPHWSATGPTAIKRPDGRGRSKIRFVDLCAGLGGFTTAGIVAGWEPLASIDHCQSLKRNSAWNFQHPYECVDLTKAAQVRPLRHRFKGVDVCLFAPPCQPYSRAGLKRPGDERTNVAVAGIKLILGWRPRLIVIECVANFVACAANPTYRKELLPRLTDAGYNVYVARCNAAQCGVPVRRDRVFIVCTLYERTTALEEHMGELRDRPMMPLVEWFPGLELVCCQPCHSSPAVFDARKSPHPTMRTGSLIPLDKKKYEARRGDAGSIHEATELSLSQKLKLAGLGPGFHWPAKGAKCSKPCCRRYFNSRWGGTLMSRGFGNIVVVQQALQVLKHCEVERPRAWAKLGSAPVGARVNPRSIPKAAQSSEAAGTRTFAPHALIGTKKKQRRKMPDRGLTMSRMASAKDRVLWLHRRLAHPGPEKMIKMLKANPDAPEWRGIKPEDIRSMGFCETCARSKLTKQPHGSLRDRDRMKGVNLLIHTDTMMRAVPSIPKKDIYVQSFVDDCSRYAWIETFKRKTFEGFSEMLSRGEARIAAQFVSSAEYRANGSGSGVRPVQRYFTDHASEMISAKQRHRLARSFIDLTVVAPSAKLSNGVAERFNRTVIDLARSLLVWSGLPIVFWAQAFRSAVFVYNRTPHSANGGETPYKMYCGKEHTDGDRLRIFGCKCYVHEEKSRRDHRSKLDPTARGCVYLGPSQLDGKSHEYFNPKTSKVLRSTSIVFDEETPGGYLVERNSLVQKRMKDLVADKWKSRRARLGDDQEGGSPAPSAGGPSNTADTGSQDQHGPDARSSEDDIWNTEYKAADNETLTDIAAKFGIGLDELRDHNTGMQGCDPVTGKTDPLARLQRGTGLWLPDDSEADVERDREERTGRAEESDAGTSVNESASESESVAEASSEEPESAEENDAGYRSPRAADRTGRWSGRLRKRGGARESEARITEERPGRKTRKHPVWIVNEELGSTPASDTAAVAVDRIKAIAVKVAVLMKKAHRTDNAGKARSFVREAEDLFTYAARVQMNLPNKGLGKKGLAGVAARDVPTPKSYREAISGPFADHWNAAVLKELNNLKDHGVYKWVERPVGAPVPIDATWAWRVKPTSDGGVDKLKARVVARGFKERYGISFAETFAPVTTLTTWRACLAEASRSKMKVSVWDISSAYLLSDIPKETPIYVQPFEGLEPPKGYRVTSRTCLLLLKGLYGLRAAGKLWNETIDARLKELGCRQSRNDPCLYIKEEGAKIIRLNLHVDDCCATYTDEEYYDKFMKELESEYKLSVAADNNMFLGMMIERTSDGGIQIHQRHYIDEILKKFNCELWKPVPTPARDSITLHKGQSPQTEEEKQRMEKVPYRQVLGSLMWLAVCTRPDLAQALGACARFCAAPGEEHWKALKWILRYLIGTKDLCIKYGSPVKDMPFGPLHGNVDSSWGDDRDDRKSTTGYNFFSYGGPIVWRSQKQKCVSLSTCEAEFIAANEAGREGLWLRRLFRQDLGHEDLSVTTYGDLSEKEFRGAKPLTIFEDNAGCIALSRNPVAHKRSKHIDIRYFWLRDKVRDGLLKLAKIDTKLNTADLHTKATKRAIFLFLRAKIMRLRETPVNAPRQIMLGELVDESPARCAVCGGDGHLESGCPLLFRPDELEEMKTEQIESKDSESLLVARPDGQHKGSNDMAEEAPRLAPMPPRLPYGAAGPEYVGKQPEALMCIRCRRVCPAELVPSGAYALMPEDGSSGLAPESELIQRNNFCFDPVLPEEWSLDTTLEGIIDHVRDLLDGIYPDEPCRHGQALTHLDLIEQIIATVGVADTSIRKMFEQEKRSTELGERELRDHHELNCPWGWRQSRLDFELQTHKEIAEQQKEKRTRKRSAADPEAAAESDRPSARARRK